MKPRLIRTEVLLLVLVFLTRASQALDSERSGTVPFIFDDNRVFAQLDFVRPDGTLRKVLAFVDLGTPALVLDKKLYEELQVGQGKPVILRVGHLEMKVDSSLVETDTDLGLTGPNGKRTVPVEAVLSGSVLTNYELVVDYAKRTLMVAQANTLKSTGDAVPCRVNEKTGMVSITAEIDGRPYALAVDTGSAYSWVREDVAEQWTKAHPDWERGKGAVGEANMQSRTGGAQARATILRLPEIKLGSLSLKQVGALGIAPEAPPIPPAPGQSKVEGSFFDWYSKKAPEPVIGWLGGNVLKGFRLMIDFPRRTTYWERVSDLDPHELDQVGATLEKRSDGYFIAGIAQKSGKPTVDTVRVGDKLIQVDDVVLGSATRGAIFAALHGKPGEVRMLVVERDGQQLTVPAKVTAF
jgi:gag-polyprotein putative aspartyl protease